MALGIDRFARREVDGNSHKKTSRRLIESNMSNRSIQENDNSQPDAEQAETLATVSGVFDSTLVVQDIECGQHNAKNRPLAKKDYKKMHVLWGKLPTGTTRAEMQAWLNRKTDRAFQRSGASSAQDQAMYVALKDLLKKVPEDADWHYIDVYLACRVQGGRVRLSEEQKEAVGSVQKVKALTKCDEFTTFGKRGGSKTEHKTAMGLLAGYATPPPGTWEATSKCVSFAQDLAKDVHNAAKTHVTREMAGQFMRQFRDAVDGGQETNVVRSYEALGAPQRQPGAAGVPAPVTPMKRLLDKAGEVVRSAKKVLLGDEGDD